MTSALFDINGDGSDQGYEAENAEVLTLQLRQQPPIGVTTVLFQVFDPLGFDATLGIAANPPRASKDAPLLTLVGPTSGQAVSPATVDGTVTITMPSTGSGSWIVRCVVNGGVRTLANGTAVVDPSLIHERGVWIPTSLGTRRVVCTELRQFETEGWAGALSTLAGVPLPPRPKKVLLHDAFMSGNTVSGSIGSLGWNLLGVGTPAFSRSAFSTAGLIGPKATLATSGATNDRATLAMGETDSRGVVIASDVKLMQLMHSFNNFVLTKRFFFGLIDNFASIPTAATSCLGIYFDTGINGNYQLLSRRAGAGSPIDTTIAPNVSDPDLLTMLQLPDGSFQFYQGETLLGAIASASIPIGSTELNVGMSIQTLAASARSHRFGRFIFESVTLGDVLSADSFLDA